MRGRAGARGDRRCVPGRAGSPADARVSSPFLGANVCSVRSIRRVAYGSRLATPLHPSLPMTTLVEATQDDGGSAASPGLGVNRIYPMDCSIGLRQLAEGSIDVAVTSPPYWGQRESPGVGVEEDPRDYVTAIGDTLDLTMRTLKPTGLLWLNIGDAYNTPGNWRVADHKYSSLGPDGNGLDAANSAYTKRRAKRRAFVSRDSPWLQYGNLLALPYRVVIGLCDLGYLFRGEVIWEKSRPMPEGRCRRPPRRHESIYIFAKD